MIRIYEKNMGTGQKKFNRNISEYNGVTNITESESLFLAKDRKKGRKGLEDGLMAAFNADHLNTYRDKCIRAFEKHTKKYMQADSLSKINAGITAYVKSSVSTSNELDVLKASILHACGTDILTKNYEYADEGTKQIIKIGYFEDVSKYLAIEQTELIPKAQIQKYIKLAQTYTKRYLGYYVKKYTPEIEIYDVEVYRGHGNKEYYKKDNMINRTAKPDILSIYSSLGTPHPYYESHLFNSYTLNRNVAEQFMLDGKNIRRAQSQIRLELLLPNMFSSFMVSANFDQKNNDFQFEFLVLPNINDLSITSRKLEDLYVEFTLSSKY